MLPSDNENSATNAIPIVAGSVKTNVRMSTTPEGRFTIIDEQPKDPGSVESDLDDLDDSLGVNHNVEETGVKESRASTELLLDSAPTDPIMPSFSTSNLPFSNNNFNFSTNQISGVSRFKIVPVASTFKRGRWTCQDYYDTDVTNGTGSARKMTKTNSQLAKVVIQQPRIEIIEFDKGRFSQNSSAASSVVKVDKTEHASGGNSEGGSVGFNIGSTALETAPAVTLSYANSGPFQTPPIAPFSSSTTATSTPKSAAASTTALLDPVVVRYGSNKASDSAPAIAQKPGVSQLLTINATNDFFNSTLNASHGERSLLENLLPGTIPPAGSPHVGSADTWISDSTANQTVPGGGGPNMVAIDSKIEQAMDLVKTHLMFAVREEVEILRSKIVDLENTMLRLESENVILRENVAPEILTKIISQIGPNSSTPPSRIETN